MSIADIKSSDGSNEILQLFPRQGEWREGDYFSLPGNRMVELLDGYLEILPLPSLLHQFLARLMFLQLHEFVERSHLGIVMTAPTRVRVGDHRYREPDVLFVSAANFDRRQAQFWETVNLVVEVVSPDDPDRDLIDKRSDYASAGIGEYWIIDPARNTVEQYLRPGDATEFMPASKLLVGHTIKSTAIPGFEIPVEALFDDAACGEALRVLMGG